MNKSIVNILALLFFLTSVNDLLAQVKIPEMSSYCEIKQTIGLTELEIKYRRPSKRGRSIVGNLVPYDSVWRTGANECTSIRFNADLSFDGRLIPAGEYCLFTIPHPDSWTIILNKDAKQWGAFRYSEKEDQLRWQTEPITLAEPIETFEIRFQNVDDKSADMTLQWENTSVVIKVESDVDAVVDASIQSMIAENSTNSWDYYFAAKYYFRSGRDTEQVMKWMEKSIALDPIYWVMFEYAEMLVKIDKKGEALETAQKALENAQEANDPRFAKNNIIPLIRQLEAD